MRQEIRARIVIHRHERAHIDICKSGPVTIVVILKHLSEMGLVSAERQRTWRRCQSETDFAGVDLAARNQERRAAPMESKAPNTENSRAMLGTNGKRGDLIEQWAWEELNLRPHAYQACALTT